MELLQFKYFLTAAQFQHVTKAAKALNIAQPALTQSIKRLESELGVELFDRKNNKIYLNSAGKLLVEKLIPIVSAVDNLKNELNHYLDAADHNIHINLLAGSLFVTNAIIAYNSIHSDIEFQLSQSPVDEIGDICIFSSTSLADITDHDKKILSEELYIAVSASSPLAEKDNINLKEVSVYNFIALNKFSPLRKLCDSYCLSAGFNPDIIFESSDIESIVNLVSAGLGISFWCKCSMPPVDSSKIKLIHISDPSCTRTLYMRFYDHSHSNPYILDFYKFITSYSITML